MKIIDSYCHIGLPRFSSADDVIATFDRFGIERGVVVLGPQVPDYPTLFKALDDYPERVRAIGIPFGSTEAEVRESFDLQIRAGVLGLRVEPGHLADHPWLLETMGQAGMWLYAINWVDHPPLYRPLLDWLERFPTAHLAAPHFLKPTPFPADPAARQLLAHPRFYAIFSRHGGMGSQAPYPHPDFRPWVEEVAQIAGWDHILWGSEYPVFYWRGESMPDCQGWLSALLPHLPEEALRAYLGETAERLFFATPAPRREPVRLPVWIEDQFDRHHSVPLFQKTALNLPMEAYAALHRRFMQAQARDVSLSFDDFVAQVLSDADGSPR